MLKGHGGTGMALGGAQTCTAALVLFVLSMQDQGKHHQQDDDQTGERHH